MHIRTNNQPRELLYASDVPQRILSSKFDYQDEDQRDNGYGYICYQGVWYHLDQFMKCEPCSDLALLGYAGYHADSFSSGVVLKIVDDEKVIMATYRV